jgi:hemerythrin-like domain-containing protein
MARVTSIENPGDSRPATFEQPFEILHACHERVHRMLTLLQRLRDHMSRNGTDEQARDAARDIMRYFDVAAPAHHLDEELHVFPALAALGDPVIADVVARLREDHVQMEVRWARARVILQAVAAGEHVTLDGPRGSALDAFAGLYAGHIEAEESIAYPRAAGELGAHEIEAMGREMMARRGLAAPGS